MHLYCNRYLFIIFVALLLGVTANESNTTKEELANDQIYELIDANFEHYISQKEYKWFILFYLKTCAHCARARKEIKKIYQTVLDSSMRFGQIEIQSNVMTSIRFNTTQVPYLVLFQDGKMFEFTQYPNEKNLNEFINSNKVLEEALPIPPRVKFMYVAWVILKDGVKSLSMVIEKYLNKKGYDIQVKPYYLVILAVGVLALFCLFQYWFISRCCAFDDFEKYIQQQEKEKEMKSKGEDLNTEDIIQEDNQQQELKETIDEETLRKEAELQKEKEMENQSNSKPKKGKGEQKQDDGKINNDIKKE